MNDTLFYNLCQALTALPEGTSHGETPSSTMFICRGLTPRR